MYASYVFIAIESIRKNEFSDWDIRNVL